MNIPRFQIKNLSLLRNGRSVLHNVNLTISSGEIVCLVGPSGSGKSSLLRCLNRLTEPPSQTIFMDGDDILEMDVLRLRRQVGMVFQAPALFPGTVADNIAYGPRLAKQLTSLKKWEPLSAAEINSLLQLADLPSAYATRPVTELSGGEAQRVSLARALANKPQTLLLDEPTGALDPAARRHIWQTIHKLRIELGLTVLWVTHTMEEVREVADRVYLLVNGRIADEGTPEHLLRPDSDHMTAEFAAGLLE